MFKKIFGGSDENVSPPPPDDDTASTDSGASFKSATNGPVKTQSFKRPRLAAKRCMYKLLRQNGELREKLLPESVEEDDKNTIKEWLAIREPAGSVYQPLMLGTAFERMADMIFYVNQRDYERIQRARKLAAPTPGKRKSIRVRRDHYPIRHQDRVRAILEHTHNQWLTEVIRRAMEYALCRLNLNPGDKKETFIMKFDDVKNALDSMDYKMYGALDE